MQKNRREIIPKIVFVSNFFYLRVGIEFLSIHYVINYFKSINQLYNLFLTYIVGVVLMVLARLTVWEFKEGQGEKGKELILSSDVNSLSNVARRSKGYKGAFLLTDNDKPDKVVTITLWESEQDMLDSRKELFQDTIDAFEKIILKPPQPVNYTIEGETLI